MPESPLIGLTFPNENAKYKNELKQNDHQSVQRTDFYFTTLKKKI